MSMVRRAGYPPEADHLRLPRRRAGQVRRSQISPADRVHLRAWLARSGWLADMVDQIKGV